MSFDVSTHSASWNDRIETAIRSLRNIEGATVKSEGDEIREIHVITSSNRPPKNIVRDVQTVLQTRFGVSIDHRVVSVAQTQPGAGRESVSLDDLEDSSRAGVDERVRFESVNLFVAGARTQAQVELKWKGMPRMGSASGFSTRDEAHRLVAAAAIAAIQEFLSDPVAFAVQGVEIVQLGKRQAAVVSISMFVQRQEKLLLGCSPVETDTPQAVVLATLAAVNRVLGGLTVKEPTEYVLRPTST